MVILSKFPNSNSDCSRVFKASELDMCVDSWAHGAVEGYVRSDSMKLPKGFMEPVGFKRFWRSFGTLLY